MRKATIPAWIQAISLAVIAGIMLSAVIYGLYLRDKLNDAMEEAFGGEPSSQVSEPTQDPSCYEFDPDVERKDGQPYC
jgi:hypothetical protein